MEQCEPRSSHDAGQDLTLEEKVVVMQEEDGGKDANACLMGRSVFRLSMRQQSINATGSAL